MYKLVVFVPEDHAEPVKQALFSAGAGRFRNYDQASWETRGTGQFRPLEGSDPYLGSQDRLERVPELRVEMLCPDEAARSAVDALLASHPYEEPAYELYRIFTQEDFR